MVVDFIIARCVMGTDLTRKYTSGDCKWGRTLEWEGGTRKKEGDTQHDEREKAFKREKCTRTGEIIT